jgi:PPP family 3-phenylpropionic acid transporter
VSVAAPVRPASLAPFGALSFAYFASVGLFNPYAPLWFQSLGMSTLAIGSIASFQAWTRVVVPYAWSWGGDHWEHGARRITLLRIAALLAFAFALCLPWVRDPAQVALVVVLIFVANGAIVPLSEAALAQHLSTAGVMDVGRYGRVRLWGSIGFVVSVSCYGVLLQAGGIGWVPAATALMFGVLVAVAWRVPAGHAIATPVAEAGGPAVWTVLRRPTVAWFFAGVFFTVLAHTALYVFFSLYLDALGYGKVAVGALWAVSVAAEIVFFWRQGQWFRRWDAHTWLLAAAVLTALRFAGVALWAGIWPLLVLLQLTHAVTFAAQHAACITLVNRYFHGRLRGRGQALYTTIGYGLSGVIGGVAGGALVQRGGYGAVFLAAAASGAIATVCCRISRSLDRERETGRA